MKSEAEELKALMVDRYTWISKELKNDLTIIGYCPEVSYFSWLFRYKNTYVLLIDMGNGYYSFEREVSDEELKRLVIDYNYIKYGKYNTDEELGQLQETNPY